MNDDTFEKKYNTLGVDSIRAHRIFCQEVLKLLPGQMAVVSNGRVSFTIFIIVVRSFTVWFSR